MNLTLFKKFMKEDISKQDSFEWYMFLEICSTYLKKHNIKNPVVVELGKRDSQKRFWEQLFNAHYTGDIMEMPMSLRQSILKKELGRKLINILFINGDHRYEAVKEDFKMFAPLCNGIIAFHGIETFRYKKREVAQVWKFWDDLRLGRIKNAAEYRDYPVLSIHKRRPKGCQRGIGVILKK